MKRSKRPLGIPSYGTHSDRWRRRLRWKPLCAKTLAALGHEGVVFDNLLFGHREFVRWGELIEGGIRDPAALDAVFNAHRIDAVVLHRVESGIPQFWWQKPHAPSDSSAGPSSARFLRPSSPTLSAGTESVSISGGQKMCRRCEPKLGADTGHWLDVAGMSDLD